MIHLILFLAIVGVIVYFITTYIPMPAPFKTAIYIIVAICVIYYLLQVFNIGDLPLPGMRR